MAACALVVFGCRPGGEDAVLVGEDGAVAPLIVAADAPPNTVAAAEDLAGLIGRISGSRPAILHEPPSPLPESAVWVGPHPGLAAAMPGVDFGFTKPEETLIVSRGGHVAILGKDQVAGGKQIMSGTANAVYSFAQQALGVRWLWPGTSGEDVVESKTIRVPEQTVRYAPVFLQRELFFRPFDANEQQWCVRQRFWHFSYRAPMGHGFDDWWEKYHQSHPEYFALQPDGTRSGYPKPEYAKVCEAEPALWEQWIENAAEEFAADPTRRVFSASQNDGSNSGNCVCERCKAWDHPAGEPQRYEWEGKVETCPAMSDRMVRFANKLGELLEERFPGEGLQVQVMAYGPSKPGPVEARPAENVAIGYVGQFPTSGDALREIEKGQFAQWADKAGFLVYRPNLFYYSGGWHGLPTLAIKNTAEDFRFLADHNCRGILVDGTPAHWGAHALQYYVMAQLAWDPYQDADALVEDFCARGFGPAAGQLREYFRLMEEAHMAVVNHPEWRASMGIQEKLSDPILPAAYTEEVLGRAEDLLEQASRALAGAPEIYRKRLELIERGQQFARLMMRTILAMNEVRRSGGKNWRAVEEAVRLVDAREAFFAEEAEAEAAKDGSRPQAIGAHRVRTTWIATHKIEDLLGPVKPEFSAAAEKARSEGTEVASASPAASATPAAPAPQVALAEPLELRWTGAAGDHAWENRANWQARAASGEWVATPRPPDGATRVLLDDSASGSSVPRLIRLGSDAQAESITVSAINPALAFRIESRPDDTGGIDADSARLNSLVLTGPRPIYLAPGACADLETDVEVRFSNPAAKMDLSGGGGAEVRLLKNNPNPAQPAASPR